MTGSWSARTIAMLSLSVALGGCLYPSRGPASAPVVSVMFITREPPPPRVEVVIVKHTEGDVWVAGHWSAKGNDYAWVKGRWAQPEVGKTEWQEGKWEHEDHGWHYTEGAWR